MSVMRRDGKVETEGRSLREGENVHRKRPSKVCMGLVHEGRENYG